jgi:hypothetical protein
LVAGQLYGESVRSEITRHGRWASTAPGRFPGITEVNMSKLVLFLLGSLLACNHAIAQSVPPLMNYQGHLTNATGQPLATGQYTLTFNVYNVPTGGTAVWGPQAIAADVIDGYFNVVLSTDSTGGDSITTAFTAQPRYVSIRVNAAEEILPRQQVLSAPYAIQAGRAGSTVGSENVFPGSGNVGIGTTTPTVPLSVSGATRLDGAVEVNGTLTTTASAKIGGVMDASTLKFAEQKFCRIGTANYRDAFVVPNTWKMENCRDVRISFGGISNWAVGCIFADGDFSEGTNGGGLPPRNCGWAPLENR